MLHSNWLHLRIYEKHLLPRARGATIEFISWRKVQDMKTTKKILILLSAILIVATGGIAWLFSNYQIIGSRLYPKHAAQLDLQGQAVSTDQYAQLHEAMPDCQILWDVPLSTGLFSSNSTELSIPALSDTDEALPEGMHPRDGVRLLAERKGAAVLSAVGDDAVVISSDTLVELNGIPLGKDPERKKRQQIDRREALGHYRGRSRYERARQRSCHT